MKSAVLMVLLVAAAAPAQTVQHHLTTPDGRTTVATFPASGPGLARPQASTQAHTDGSWQQCSVPPGVFVRAISMGSPQVGFAAAELGIVLRTTDGGLSWQTVLNEGFPAYYYGVHAFNEQTVVVTGFNNSANTGIIRWSDNGGATWNPVVSLNPGMPINWLYFTKFADTSRGVIQAAMGTHHTTSGGRTAADWHFVRPSENWFQGPFTFLPDNRVWMTGHDNFRSADGGASWSPLPNASPIFDGANSILADGRGFIGGGSIAPTVAGWAYSTANGGDSWSAAPVLQTPYPVRALLRLDGERAWAAGGNYFSGVGGIWGTTNGGATWTLQQNTGAEILDLQWVRVNKDEVDVYAAGQVSQIWRLRVDFPAGGGCYADCDGDDALTLADFGCFQTKFALGDPYADCNGDLALNLADFGCFQTEFALGCP